MLLPFLPNQKVLRPGAFKLVLGTDKKRLTLACTHSAVMALGKSDIHGVDEVQYLIDTKDSWNKPNHNLTVDNSVPPVGEQSASSVLAFYKSINPRRSGNTVLDGTFTFDFRSTEYVLGAVSGQVTAKVTTDFGNVILPKIVLLSPTHTLSFSDQPLINQMMWSNANEYVTLLTLLGASGARSVAVPGDTVPRKGKKLTGLALGSYVLRIHAVILSMANSTSCTANHDQAFFEGQTSVLRLNAHTDEGGFVRGPLGKKMYPAPRGALLPGTAEISGLSTVNSVRPSEVAVWSIANFLEGCGRLSRADPSNVVGVPTIMENEDGLDKPSSYPGLEQGFYDLMKNWRLLCAEERGYVATAYPDGSSSRPYFDTDASDRHLGAPQIVPFFFVEPSGISTVKKSAVTMPAVQGSGGSLPFLKDAKVIKTKAYSEYKGRVGTGSKVFLYMPKGHHARENGLHYIFSSRYRKENGLSQFEAVTAHSLGVVAKDYAMADNETDLLSEKRWETPHNCLPNPAELYTERRACFRYTYSGARYEPTAEDFERGEVDFTISPLYIPKKLDGSTKAIHKDVPDHLLEMVRNTHLNRKLGFGAEEDEFEEGYEAFLEFGPNPVPLAVDPGALTPAAGELVPEIANEEDIDPSETVEDEEIEIVLDQSGGLIRPGVESQSLSAEIEHDTAYDAANSVSG
ncbi:coat protein [Diatom colony associated dsRNA virus 9 genome type A]|uniref:coat protein n=1 Tax=Diatom colony associated dsRNA virus 9 genome type A TaxID=1678168 RepID=UPI0007A67FF7|nr:coat protein [Diatom colony associated dsRNA virus 9 genome type A]BAU79499.1 coat protein [Diatom colony associated dsRNA virus 9 genome type A]